MRTRVCKPEEGVPGSQDVARCLGSRCTGRRSMPPQLNVAACSRSGRTDANESADRREGVPGARDVARCLGSRRAGRRSVPPALEGRTTARRRQPALALRIRANPTVRHARTGMGRREGNAAAGPFDFAIPVRSLSYRKRRTRCWRQSNQSEPTCTGLFLLCWHLLNHACMGSLLHSSVPRIVPAAAAKIPDADSRAIHGEDT